MPTYDYQCAACGHAFEKFQSMTARVLRKCPSCGKPKLERLIGTGAAVIFKGSGFYQTDYRSDSYKQAAKKDETAPAAAPSSSSSSEGSTTATTGAAAPAAGSADKGSGKTSGKKAKSES